MLKILWIFVFAYVVFFAYNVANTLLYTETDIALKSYFSLKILAKAVCFCTIGFAVPLWYLIAMAETYAVWYFVVKAKKSKPH